MREWCTIIFLGLNAWCDWKKQQVSLLAIGIFSALGIGEAVLHNRVGWELWVPMSVGIVFLGVSLLTHGDIGMGDGLVMTALGTMLDMEIFLISLCLGLFCSAIWALVLLVVRKRSRKTAFPFIPFLLLGYIGGIFL